eukprot:1758778-Prymnesium_polylepis.1
MQTISGAPYALITDASDYAVGATLMLIGNDVLSTMRVGMQAPLYSEIYTTWESILLDQPLILTALTTAGFE